MIHCDEVFDILTRGPFPTGAPSDGIVEAHLSHCDACRQLAEALRPAIELLQEAIAPEESDGLPRYGGPAARSTWSDGDPSPLKTKQRVLRPATRAATTLRLKTAAWPWRPAAKFAAAACIGLALAGMLRQVTASRESLRGGSLPSVAQGPAWHLAIDGRQWAVAQGLSDRCLNTVAGLNVVATPRNHASSDALELACCSGCHAAQSDHLLPLARIERFVHACQACH